MAACMRQADPFEQNRLMSTETGLFDIEIVVCHCDELSRKIASIRKQPLLTPAYIGRNKDVSEASGVRSHLLWFIMPIRSCWIPVV